MHEESRISPQDAPRYATVTPDFVRKKLKSSPPVDPALAPLMDEIELRPAAVLLPLLQEHGEWSVLFTRRTHLVSSHKGEISFPGGRIDPEDPHPEAAALRETYEEIGTPPEQIEIFGRLPDSFSIAGYRITPYVGHLRPLEPFQPNPHEIDEIFTVPLQKLLEPGILRLKNRVRAGLHEHDVYLFRWRETHTIWGATARILKTFLEQLFGPLKVESPPHPTILDLPPETKQRLRWRSSQKTQDDPSILS
ncbi:MAG: CoA pyrophosphatase [Myxococcales bacterium]|nr:CoA pyrophosphatase [Myxococcales bacterium]